jgi:hypothetical protein
MVPKTDSDKASKPVLKTSWVELGKQLIAFAQRNRRALARIGQTIRQTAQEDGMELSGDWKTKVFDKLQAAMPKGITLDTQLVNKCLQMHNQRQMANKLDIAEKWESAGSDRDAANIIKLTQAKEAGDEETIAQLEKGGKRMQRPIDYVQRFVKDSEKVNNEQLTRVIPDIVSKLTTDELTLVIGELSRIIAERKAASIAPVVETAARKSGLQPAVA